MTDLEQLKATIIANATGIADAAGQRALSKLNQEKSWLRANAKSLVIGHASMGAIWALVHFIL